MRVSPFSLLLSLFRRLLKKRLFAAQDIFSDNASVRSAEKSQVFRALRSPRVIRGENMIRAQSHCRSSSATLEAGNHPATVFPPKFLLCQEPRSFPGSE
jgi:hypothetical protein